MNQTYIKRQLVLSELNYPLEQKIDSLYKEFKKFIGNINNMKKFDKRYYIFWTIDEKSSIECYYNKPLKQFTIGKNKKYTNVLYGNPEFENYLKAFLEHIFNVEVNSVFVSKSKV